MCKGLSSNPSTEEEEEERGGRGEGEGEEGERTCLGIKYTLQGHAPKPPSPFINSSLD
jgi:hypothetical protein